MLPVGKSNVTGDEDNVVDSEVVMPPDLPEDEAVVPLHFASLMNESKEAYSRLAQPGVRIIPGRYRFSCLFRADDEFGFGDHAPGFWEVADSDLERDIPVYEPITSGWRRYKCNVTIKADGEFIFNIAMWQRGLIDFASLSLKTEDGEELLKNGDFGAGLDSWESMEGTLSHSEGGIHPTADKQ